MKVKKLVATVAVFGAGFAAFSTGSTVQAEPVSNSYVVVGSDTIEDVLNALVNGTAITGATVRVTQNGATLGSFDATGGPSIITRPGGVRFSRPNGSSEGFQALSASISTDPATQIFTSGTYQPVGVASVAKTAVPNYWMAKSLRNINIFGQVDIARSSSSLPASTVLNANGTIARIPFGRDAFGLAFTPSLATKVCDAGQDSDAGTGCAPYLTTAQIKTIFDANGAGAFSTLTIGTTEVPVKGIMPQQGSGTYNDFTKSANTNKAQEAGNFAAGEIGYSQEHDATGLTGDQVMPMSASRWIAMKNGASFNRAGTAVLGSVFTATTQGASPIVGAAGSMTPSLAYYADTTWGRDTFLFVERARITSGDAKYDANLAALMDPSLNKLANVETTGSSKAGKVKALYGLLPPVITAVTYYDPKPQTPVLDND